MKGKYKDSIKLSKFMSKILRHSASEYNIKLDDDGFCKLDELLNVLKKNMSNDIVIEDIFDVVESCDKQRYEVYNDKIRTRYGHSQKKLQYSEAIPPNILYHGTHLDASDIILKEGIKSMNRNYVHLSDGTSFAEQVGKRRGQLVMLTIDTKKALEMGVKFYYAGKETWLVDFVPAQCISIKQ